MPLAVKYIIACDDGQKTVQETAEERVSSCQLKFF
jgi:hypothetical protein